MARSLFLLLSLVASAALADVATDDEATTRTAIMCGTRVTVNAPAGDDDGLLLLQPTRGTHLMQHDQANAELNSRRMMQALTPPPMCVWSGPNAMYKVGQCTDSYAYIATLKNRSIAKTSSTPAQLAINGAAGSYACYAHNVTTMEGMDACVADTANKCYMSWDTSGPKLKLRCYTAATFSTVGCPGSKNQDLRDCRISNRTSCSGKCTWMPVASYGTAKNQAGYEAYLRNLTMGKYEFDFGFCLLNELVEPGMAAFTATGIYDYNAYVARSSALFDSRNPATYLANYGNCSLALNDLANIQYTDKCYSFNTFNTSDQFSIGRALVRDDKLANSTNIMGCLQNKCLLASTITASYLLERYNVTYGAIACAPDTSLINARLYNKKKDKMVYKAKTKCSSARSEAACLGIKE